MDDLVDIPLTLCQGNNKVFAFPNVLNNPNVKIQINGYDNTVIIAKSLTTHDLFIDITGNNATIKIGENCKISGSIFCGENSKISIGNYLKCNHPINLRAFEESSIHIGNHCLFANVFVETSDYHTIFDLETKKPINTGKSIVIGDRVWCARNVIVSKGTILGNDVVVGANSFVNKQFGSNIIIAGCPAKVIKKNIVWTELRGAKEMPEQLGSIKR